MKKNFIVAFDDNEDFLNSMREQLIVYFDIKTYTEPEEGIRHTQIYPPDLILLDLHLPNTTGYEVFHKLRAIHPGIPILFLSGDDKVDSKIKSFDLGAEDFLVKPIQTEELVSRIRNRIIKYKLNGAKRIKIDELEINLDLMEVRDSDEVIQLTPKEFSVLLLLAQNPDVLITREEILNTLWKDVFLGKNNIDTHFSNLRRKLKASSWRIKTVKNSGYILKTKLLK